MASSTIKYMVSVCINDSYKQIRTHIDFVCYYDLIDRFYLEFLNNRQYIINAIIMQKAQNETKHNTENPVDAYHESDYGWIGWSRIDA
jgi:hypothetical protein